MKRHTIGFREQAVQKALQGGSVPLKQIARDLDIGYSTLHKWIRDARNYDSSMNSKQRPQDWTAEQRFQTLMKTHDLDETQVSAYCRQNGLFTHQLAQWRQTFIQPESSVSTDKKTVKALQQEIKTLNRELTRKEKALAEAAALLILQKKFNALLEEKEE